MNAKVLAVLLAPLIIASAAFASPSRTPQCLASQLRVSVDGRDGDFNGMSHSGTELSVRNLGHDCMLPGLPLVQFRDAHGRVLQASRQAPVGMHPGPVVVPVRLAAGHRAATELRWVSSPVFDHSAVAHVASVKITVGGHVLRALLRADIYGEAGHPIGFQQTFLRAM